MIAADLDYVVQQVPRSPAFEKAIAFLRRRDARELPDGRVDIDGDRIYAIVQRYETVKAETPKFECHRKYIDVQFIVSGREIIGWSPVGRMTVTEPYDEGKDVCFGAVEKGTWTPVYLEEGQLAVLWPDDGHAPKIAAGMPGAVVKIVVKMLASPGRERYEDTRGMIDHEAER
jgi:YhcH/YjgK/YiaL family protein